jgi:hypothetical protein
MEAKRFPTGFDACGRSAADCLKSETGWGVIGMSARHRNGSPTKIAPPAN